MLRQNFWLKNIKMDVKTSFFDVMSEVQEDLEDVAAGIDKFFKNPIVRYHSGGSMKLNACILILAHMVYL